MISEQAAQAEAIRLSALRALERLPDTPGPSFDTGAGNAVQRERQRFELLVLGAPRPKVKRMVGKRAGRRKPQLREVPLELDPEIESAVALREKWSHKNQGTPQTHEHNARTQQGALARLCLSGGIDGEQLASAEEIAAIAEHIAQDVTVSSASLEARVDQSRSGDGTFFERLGQVRREVAYTRWRAEVRGPLNAVLDMIVGDAVGFTVVARRYGMHNRRAKQLLIDALDLWPRILGGVCKEIDPATLAAAHAGILG